MRAGRHFCLLARSCFPGWPYLTAPLWFLPIRLATPPRPSKREIPGLFSIFYSAFILPLHQGLTFWPVIFVQAAILSHLVYLTVRTVTRGQVGMRGTLAIIAALTIFSSLPWVVGEILPDVFAPVSFARHVSYCIRG